MEPIKDASHLFEHERLVYHAERPGYRISELQISPTQQVPWHCHSNVQDTFYVIEGTSGSSCAHPRRRCSSAPAIPIQSDRAARTSSPMLGIARQPSSCFRYRRVRLRSARVARQRGRAGTVCDSPGRLPARRDHHGVFRALDEFNHHARDGGLPSRHAMASSADDAC
jgi:hypothetical protein